MAKDNKPFLLFFLLVSSLPKPLVLGVPLREQRCLHRPDPLRGFKPYEGGYDVGNRHYWASAAFTGIYGYVIAGVWILAGLAFLGILVGSKKLKLSSGSNSSCYLLPILAIFLFTFLVMVTSGIVLAVAGSFKAQARKLQLTMFGAVKEARHVIRRVVHQMRDIHKRLCPYNKTICDLLGSTSTELRMESKSIREVMLRDGQIFQAVLGASYGATMGIVAINLVLVIAAIVMLMLRWRWHLGLVMIIFICWILTGTFWVLTGFHMFFQNFIDDTCSALKEFEQNPNNNTIRSILPCADPAYANYTMAEIGFQIHGFISQVNSNITMMLSTHGFEGQHGTLPKGFGVVCDPFSNPPTYNYDPTSCSSSSIPIGDIPSVFESIKPFLSNGSYSMIYAYTDSFQGFVNVLPDLQELISCSFVNDAFSDAFFHQCKPLRVSIQLLWLSLLFLSICMVVLEVSWIVKTLQGRERWLSRESNSPEFI